MPRRRSSVVTAALALAVVSTGASGVPAGAETAEEPLPLLTIDDFDYVGAFALPADDYGESDLNYSEGPLEFHDGSIFIVGHSHQNAIAQFTVPPLVDSTRIADLNVAVAPTQDFATVLDRPTGGNDQGTNRIAGLEYHDGQLIVNAYEYYDAPADNTDTTLVVRDAGDLGGSAVDGYFSLEGRARAAGWMTGIPGEWQEALGGTHLVGHSSGIPIISRTSVGPSAYAIDADDVLSADLNSPNLATETLLEFSLENRLADDLSNESGANDLWTHLSATEFGFIVPGTRTYVTLGNSGGHDSGVGYKITQDDGNTCGGYCAFEADDNANYYWLWDLDDLVSVRNATMAPHAVRPYASGPWTVPFDTNDRGFNTIGGGTFDEDSGTLYLSIQRANDEVGTYANPPIVVAYQFPGFTGDPFATACEDHTDSIVRLYAAAFGRDPEPAGFRYWLGEYRSGRWSLPAMAAFFASSDEFTSRYGAPTDRSYVNQLYVNTLGRGSDAEGLDYWTEWMGGDRTRGDALLMFAESPENVTNTSTAVPALGYYNRGVAGPLDCV